MQLGGMSFVTTAFAPTTLFAPIDTPGSTTTLAPRNTRRPIRVSTRSRAMRAPRLPSRSVPAGCDTSTIVQRGAIQASSSTSTWSQATMCAPCSISTRLPISNQPGGRPGRQTTSSRAPSLILVPSPMRMCRPFMIATGRPTQDREPHAPKRRRLQSRNTDRDRACPGSRAAPLSRNVSLDIYEDINVPQPEARFAKPCAISGLMSRLAAEHSNPGRWARQSNQAGLSLRYAHD